MNITTAAEKGPREHQEDTHFVYRDESRCVLVVMDGHCDGKVSKFCLEKINDLIVEFSLKKESLMSMLHQLVARLVAMTSHFISGSTLSIAWIENNEVTVAILGDSPVLVVDMLGAMHLSNEHNVMNRKEKKLVQARGAQFIEHVYILNPADNITGLQITRVLGDKEYEGIVLRDPEVYSIANPQYVIVASDGFLFPDREKNKPLAKRISKKLNENSTADELMKQAQKRGLWDNTTVVLWRKK